MAYYNEEEIKRARKVDLVKYLQQCGYDLIKSGRNEFRLKEHDSLVISNNKWHWFSQGTGGNIIDFLIKYEGKDFTNAVGELLGESKVKSSKKYNYQTCLSHNDNKKDKEGIELQLPEKNKDYRRLFAYLIKTRGIDKKIVQDLVNEKLIYESKGTHNVVFLGRDEEGTIKYANMRGTLTKTNKPFKGDCIGSKKEYAFNLKGKNDNIFVFESVIDLLSHATLYKIRKEDYTKDHRVVMGGLSALSLHQYLNNNRNIKNIILCLDNDKAGRNASKRIASDLKSKGEYSISQIEPPMGKDWNDYLKKYLIKMKKREDRAII